MAMLDLSVYKVKTFDVILLDGKEIGLPVPTQRTVIKLVEAEEFIKKASGKKGDANPKLVMQKINSLVLEILNTNIQGIEFTMDYIEKEFNLEIIMILLDNYMGFVQEVNSDPN